MLMFVDVYIVYVDFSLTMCKSAMNFLSKLAWIYILQLAPIKLYESRRTAPDGWPQFTACNVTSS